MESRCDARQSDLAPIDRFSYDSPTIDVCSESLTAVSRSPVKMDLEMCGLAGKDHKKPNPDDEVT
jgi:hypothetical protein